MGIPSCSVSQMPSVCYSINWILWGCISGGHSSSLSRPCCRRDLEFDSPDKLLRHERSKRTWGMNMCTGCPASSSVCFLLSESDNRTVSQNLLRWLLSGRSQQKQGERKLTKGLISLRAVSVSGRLAMQTNESVLELGKDFWQIHVFVTATFIGDNWHDCVLSRHFEHFCIISCLVQGCESIQGRTEVWGLLEAAPWIKALKSWIFCVRDHIPWTVCKCSLQTI